MPVQFDVITTVSNSEKGGAKKVVLANTASAARIARTLLTRRGRNTVPLARIAAGRKLKWGAYLLQVTATNSEGVSRTAALQFWILPEERRR